MTRYPTAGEKEKRRGQRKDKNSRNNKLYKGSKTEIVWTHKTERDKK